MEYSPISGEIDVAAIDFDTAPDFTDLRNGEFEQTLCDAEALLQSTLNSRDSHSGAVIPVRVDAAKVDAEPASASEPTTPIDFVAIEPRAERPVSSLRSKSPGSCVPWSVLALGLAVFVCGAALMGWSLAANRPQLWQLGLPLMLVGQVAVLAVVISQLEAVWQSNRSAFLALHKMDEQVREFCQVLEQRETIAEREPSESSSDSPRTDQSRPHIRLAKKTPEQPTV